MTPSPGPIQPHHAGSPGRVIQGFFPGGRPRIIQAAPAPVVPAPLQPRPASLPAPIIPGRPATGALQPALRPQAPQPILPKQAAPSAVQPHAGNAFPLPGNFTLKPRGSGQPLPESIQKKMESFFNASFADVRVHVGNEASSIGALAFTHGTDLYFAPGQYNPQSTQGQQLLGHELTHVVQQRAGRVRNPSGSGIAVVQDPALEAEAERMGLRAVGYSIVKQFTECVRNAALKPSSNSPESVKLGGPLSGGGVLLPSRDVETSRTGQDSMIARRSRGGVPQTSCFSQHTSLRAAFPTRCQPIQPRMTDHPPSAPILPRLSAPRSIQRMDMVKPIPMSSEYHGLYETTIFEATKGLEVGFAHSAREKVKGRKYNSQYWRYSKSKETFTLKSGVKPSVAIKSIYEQRGEWDLDCAEHTSVSRLFTLLTVIGANEFDKAFIDKTLYIDSLSATGLETSLYLERENKDEPFVFKTAGDKEIAKSSIFPKCPEDEDKLLAKVPIGSRVMWTNDDPNSADSDFENENALKVGPNLYSAHPFGILSAQELRKQMSDPDPRPFIKPEDFDERQQQAIADKEDPDQMFFLTDRDGYDRAVIDYYTKYIFLSEIEFIRRGLKF